LTDAPAAAPPEAPSPKATIVELAKLLDQLGRSDLATRAQAAAARLDRPGTVVCVVGEFKQGKSSLVNALLGQRVCPVDDDLATSAITLVRFGEEPAAIVRRKGDDGQPAAVQVPIEQLPDWVSESGNPRNHKQVERVDISVNSPLLKQGLVVVDTPGMGGLGAGHAAATLGFLPFADGLVFVSDSSAELAAPEVDFLRRAMELCPSVVFAQTKSDLYGTAARIHELNLGHLARAGIDIPIVQTSSHVRDEALARRDRDLNDRSGIPALVTLLSEQIVLPAKENAAERSTADARSIVAMVRAGLEGERTVLADPAAAQAAMAGFEEAKQRLEHLRGPAARWSTVVADRMADLANTVNFDLRGAMRTISRNMDEMVETLQRGDTWDDMVRDLQADVADEVTSAFVALEEGRQAIRAEVIELLDEEDLGLATSGSRLAAFEVGDLWRDKALDGSTESGRKKAFSKGITTLRGAQGGVMMFGMMGQFLPKAAGALLATNPVLLGVGAVFGGLGLADERKRKVQMRRQAARTQVRQFLDDVQFEVGNQISTMVRDVQRGLRDEFTERLTELQRTYTEAAKRSQEDMQRGDQERKQRAAEVDQSLGALAKIDAALGAAR
jgi:hypothetical protein